MDLNVANEKTMSLQKGNEENNNNLAEESNHEVNAFGIFLHIFL